MTVRSPLRRFAVILPFFFFGCAPASVSVSKNYDFSKVDQVAILGFQPAEGIPESAAVLSGVFEKQFLQAGYRVVERREVEKILKEQNFQLSGAVSPPEAARIGNLLGVQALILGSVTVFSKHETGVVLVDVESVSREPVLSKRTVETVQDGKKTKETLDVVVDYKTTKEIRQHPQVYRVQAEAGAVVKMVDVQSGEIAWVGSATDEGTNIQVAAEMVGRRIFEALKKFLPAKNL